MTKLEKLYSIIENSRDVGVNLPKDVVRQVEELEENIIKDEILPALSSDIAPRLEPIKRDLVLVVEYRPGEPISVALSRKVKISEIIDAKPLTPSVSEPVRGYGRMPQKEAHEPTKQVLNPTKGLRVTWPDGTVIAHRKAIDTMAATLRRIGLQRVSSLGIMHAGYNLVDRRKRPTDGQIWQHECDGWYVYANISNHIKINDLKKISRRLRLGLKIEEGDKLQ